MHGFKPQLLGKFRQARHTFRIHGALGQQGKAQASGRPLLLAMAVEHFRRRFVQTLQIGIESLQSL